MVSRLAWFRTSLNHFSGLFCIRMNSIWIHGPKWNQVAYFFCCMFEPQTYKKWTEKEKKNDKKIRRRWNVYQEARDINTLNCPSHKPIIVVQKKYEMKKKRKENQIDDRRNDQIVKCKGSSSYDSQFINKVTNGAFCELCGEKERTEANRRTEKSLMIVRSTFFSSIHL